MTEARFHVCSGEIADRNRPVHARWLTLSEAFDLVSVWSLKALTYQAEGRAPLANLCKADARALCVAIHQAIEWRRAAGHTDLHAPDRVRKVS